MNPFLTSATCAALLTATALAQPQPTLLADLQTTLAPGDSNPAEYVTLGTAAFFTAVVPSSGREIYRTDGTTAGTTLLADLVPGPDSSNPRGLVATGTNLFFIATDPATGSDAIWVSDGTTAGTVALKDLGTVGADYLTAGAGGRYVARRIGISITAPTTLCLSDGTVAGTVSTTFPPAAPTPLLIIPAAFDNLVPGTVGGTEVVYTVVSSAGNVTLVQTDGTLSGTQTVAQFPIPAVATGLVGVLEVTPGNVAIRINSPGFGTTTVVDVQTGATINGPTTVAGSLVVANGGFGFDNRAFFSSIQLLAIDAAGSETVITLASGPLSQVRTPQIVGGSLYFIGFDGSSTRLARLDPGSSNAVDLGAVSGPTRLLASLGMNLLFTEPVSGTVDLNVLDTTTGTVTNLASSPGAPTSSDTTELGGILLTTFADAAGVEPWSSDGTPAGTGPLANLAPSFQAGPGSLPRDFTTLGNVSVLVANGDNGPTLFVTDGTAAAPAAILPFAPSLTIRAADRVWVANPESASVVDPSTGSVLAAPTGLTVIDGEALGDGVLARAGDGLFRIDNDGSAQLLALGLPTASTAHHVFGETAFAATPPVLVRTDGTVAGTTLLFTATIASTPLVTGFDGRLWITDTTNPQIRLTSGGEPTTGAPVTAPNLRQFVVNGDRLFLIADPVTVTDGTGAGTMTIVSVSSAQSGVAFRDGVLLAGASLAFTDGSPEVPLHPGPIGDIVTVSRDTAYFVVDGDGLWRTDGTLLGTTRVFPSLDVVSAGFSDGRVFLGVDDPMIGIEPYVFRPEVVNAPVGNSCSGHPTGTLYLQSDDPRIGQTVTIRGRSRFDGAGAGTLATLFLGSAGPAAPLSALSKCEVFLDPAQPFLSVQLPVNADGEFQTPLPIPPFPILVGAEIMLQAFVTPSPAPVGLDATNGLLWVIGG